MGDKTTNYQNNREKLLNRSKIYYGNSKHGIRDQARNKYR